ncbi:hypothetical protein M8013_22790 [Enterobacteriaceae bacterium H4N4]|uniref:Uncharacterized protein n=1 Tax=Silvania confinis TaxID=2926470 RepID=A0A9J6QT42_9ENTR|nr:hypothetical protein [Silvania confinis]MCU6671549.1 hypothetical protein [Silvania confinis]
MEKSLIASVCFVMSSLFTGETYAVTQYTLDCPGRDNIVLERAPYKLNTIGWDDKFFVGSGDKKLKLISNASLHMMTFTNGDRLIYEDDFANVYMIYADTSKIHTCLVQSSESIDPQALPHVRWKSESKASDSES